MWSNSSLTRNVLSSVVVRLASAAAGLLLFPFIAAQVGLSDYGLWLLVGSSVGFFLIWDLGMNVTTQRAVAERHALGDMVGLNELCSTSLGFFACLGAVITFLYVGAMALLWPHLDVPAADHRLFLEMVVWAALSTFLLGFPLGVFNSVLLGIQRADVANAILLFQTVLRVLVIGVLLVQGLSILAIVITEALLGIGGGICAWIACRRFLPELRLSISALRLRLLRELAPFSVQVFALSASALVIFQIDSFVIGAFLPVALVTVYAAGFRIYFLLRQLTYAFVNPLAPFAARHARRQEENALQRVFVQGTRLSNLVTLFLTVPAIVLAEPLLVAWAGEDFRAAAPVLRILAISLLINNNHLVAYALLLGKGSVGAYLRYQIIWAVANVAISLLLVQRLELAGVALGTAIPVVLLEPFYLRMALAEFGTSPRAFLSSAVFKPAQCAVLAAVPLVLALALMPDRQSAASSLLMLGVYWAVFGLLAVLFGLAPEDRQLLAPAWQRLRYP
jgi:O-antigen/teichoic acid export membrane protein